MPENAIKVYDGDIEISDFVPERYGYNFIGWSATKDGDAAYHAKDIYSENNDLTLYAVWEAKTFAVSFETNGGSVQSGGITQYTYGTGARCRQRLQRKAMISPAGMKMNFYRA